MTTTTKTWTWDSDLESFSLSPGSDSSIVRDTGNGSPTNGSIKHVTSGRNKSSLGAPSTARLVNVTWEDLGVPSGATVTNVQVIDIRTYYGLTDTNTVDQYGPVTVHLYANGTTTEVTGSSVYARSGSASADSSWQPGSQAQGTVGGSYQDSTTALDVQIDFESDNGNNASAASSVHADYLRLTITYSAATPQHSETGSISPSGSLSAKPGKNLSGSLGFSGSLSTHTPNNHFTLPGAALSFTGALTRRLSAYRSLTGGLSFSGALTASTNRLKALTGGLTFGGSLTPHLKTNHQSFTAGLTFTGSLTASGADVPALTAVHVHTE